LGGTALWDNTRAATWDPYRPAGNPTNPDAWGGHSDALDWDRYLGHVSIIYDMLLPYFLTKGALSDDNFNISESGNGIPDILDEARFEVDFWLRLRHEKGYSHGLNNPNSSNTFYQAGTTAVAAWANAANAAMLADCYRISGHTELMTEYRDSAMIAYDYACGLQDQQLTRNQDVGTVRMSGNDFRITAAAFLYNLTGNTRYEDDLNEFSRCTSASSIVCGSGRHEIYALAGYLFTNQEVNYPTLFSNMKEALIREAKSQEANYSNSRPSRRSTDQTTCYFVTTINTQRTIIAHAVSEKGSADRELFENALILEADYSLGRNPLNMIHMTTATTGLADKKSVENAYTSGWNDGVPGVHPGHTPYMNHRDWSGSMIMGNPTWMTNKNYPSVGNWPIGELYYNTRYVYAANEFTPQESMRGKTALYGYLYGIRPVEEPTASPSSGTVNKNTTVTLSSNTTGATIYYTLDGSAPSATNGSKYTEAIVITSDVSIRAIAVKENMSNSKIADFEYIIMKHVEKPTASVLSGTTVNVNSTVELSSATTGATIYYTLDGSEPSTTSGLEYTGQIVITDNVKIRAIAVKEGMLDSEIAVFEYFIHIQEIYLDFDTYVVTKWNNTFMLNMRLLLEEDYTVTGCKWYKNGELIGEGFTYSAGEKKTDLLEAGATYYFELETDSHGTVRSTEKNIILIAATNVIVYPNPVPAGGILYVETSEAGIPIEIYNQSGVCVKQLVSTGKTTEITLNLQAGNYIVKTNTEEIKVIVK
jgi:hypothetical protein